MEKPAQPLSATASARTGAAGPARWLWLGLAWCSIAVATIGVLLPGLPTVEFIVLAAWAASRGSPSLHRWIENHRLFGGLLQSWRNGLVSRRTKVFATLTMGLSIAVAILCIDHFLSLAITVAGIGCGLLWVWSRPEAHFVRGGPQQLPASRQPPEKNFHP